MLLIRTRIGPSSIHGSGVFACEAALCGTAVWRFDPAFDRLISEAELTGMPVAFREYIDMYAYHSADLGGRLLLPCDHAKFLNHSVHPNTKTLPFISVANRLIEAGDEITCDYGAFCLGWAGFDEVATLPPKPHAGMDQDALPHRNLYTKIKASPKGVGLFAIRAIPCGTPLFVGDIGSTVRIPASVVESIADPEMRRMYIDFCPVVGNDFVAPSDFNQITMSWYMNHSDTPNVTATPELQFVTSRFVPAGEELTADYTTYSGHAGKYAAAWNEG
jgi:uncharacterized protein